MDTPKTTVVNSRLAGDVLVLDVDGEFTRVTQARPTLSELVKSNLIAGKDRILLNFGKTGFVDSYGVGEVLTGFISVQNSGGKFKLCRVPGKLLLIFKITGLDKVLAIYPTEEAALEAFAEPPERGPEGPAV